MKLNTKGKIASLFSLAVLVASVFLDPSQVYAASAGLSVSKTSVEINEKFVVSVGVTDAAGWDVHVVATGPVASCGINETHEPSVADSETVLDTIATSSPVFSVDCMATEAGEVSLALSGAIVDGEGVRTEISRSASVTATAPIPPEPEPEPEPKPTPPRDDPEPAPEPTPEPVDDGGEGNEPSNPEAPLPVAPTTDSETPSEGSAPEAPESEDETESSDAAEAETKEEGDKIAKDENNEDDERALTISGSSDDNTKKTLVIVLAVVATLIGLLEAFLILSSRRKERLQTLREKIQALHVVTTTMQLSQALDKKS